LRALDHRPGDLLQGVPHRPFAPARPRVRGVRVLPRGDRQARPPQGAHRRGADPLPRAQHRRGQEGPLDRRRRGAVGAGQAPSAQGERARGLARLSSGIDSAAAEAAGARGGPRRLRRPGRQDAARAAAALLVGCGAAAAGELVATIAAAPARPAAGTLLRLLLLDLSLFAVLYLALVPLVIAAGLGVRLLLWTSSRERALGFAGLLAPARPYQGPRAAAAWVWGGAAGVALYVAASARATRVVTVAFKEQALAALLLAGVQIALAAVAVALAFAVASLARRGAGRLHGRLGRWSPLGHPTAAVVAILLLLLPAAVVLLR